MLKNERILALDIGTSGLKLAEFIPTKAGAVELVNFAVGVLGLGPGDAEDRAKYLTLTIREMMREKEIKPGPVLLTVSGQTVFSRFVKLPPVDKDKIGQIVAYEAQQNVPFPIDEVVWDYQLIGTGKDELDVMLVAIKGEIIESITTAVEEAGLAPDLVDVAPMALYNAARYNNADAGGCTLLIDIGARSTDLVFLEANRVFIRSIPVAGNSITQQIARDLEVSFEDAEDLKLQHAFVGLGGAYESHENATTDAISKIVRGVMTRMHAEISRSISFYRGQQNGSKPVQILLTGGTSVIPGTDRFFREKLQVKVDYFNPFENVAVSESIDTGEITEYVNVLGQTVGLALRRLLTCPIEINLMPARVLANKALRRRRPAFVMAGIGVVLTLLVWTGFFYKMGQLAGERLEIVDGKVASLRGVQSRLSQVQGEIRTVQDDIDVLQALPAKRATWNRLLTEIRQYVPEGIWLTSIVPLPPKEAAADPAATGATMFEEAFFAGGGTAAGGGGTGVEPLGNQTVGRVDIAGEGYTDKVRSASIIRDFRDRLRASPLFSDETEITWQPPPANDSVVRMFKIEVVLEEPVDL